MAFTRHDRRTLDNYWIQKKLGRGKYSEVYEATNANNDEK
jgi:hypothetical protein